MFAVPVGIGPHALKVEQGNIEQQDTSFKIGSVGAAN